MAQLTGRLGRRFGLPGVVNGALTFYLTVMSLLLALTLAGVDNVFVLAGLMFVSFGAMGLVIPSTAALARENYGATAGTASALMGTLQLVVGVAVVGIVSAFSTGKPLPVVLAMVVCALIAFLIGRATLSRSAMPSGAVQPAE